ncbi:MAG: lycopene beta-cyclase CrtY [Vicinamibacteria bacterium]
MTDVLIVGGGLAGTLLAYRLRQLRPGLAVTVLEQGPRLGGRHTWSFHDSDVTAEQRAWLAPFVAASWSGYDVRFPGLARTISGGYRALTSDRLHEVASNALADVRCGDAVRTVGPEGAVLADGTAVAAACVLDARGAGAWPGLELGWQKFLGQRLRLSRPHGLARPVLMDATVAQQGGFRFVYVLPWTESELLVEDTCYSRDPELDRDALRAEIARYAQAHGWVEGRVVAEEEGVLPIPLGGDVEALLRGEVPTIGMRAGLFHFTTGYSLPEAVRLADALAPRLPLPTTAVAAWVRDRARAHWRQGAYLRLLNRLLFRAARPDEGYRVLERFYRLPETLIARFYAGALTVGDRVRLLAGRPPVPLGRAARVLLGWPA